MRHGLFAGVALLGLMSTAQAGETAAGFSWRVNLVNQKSGTSRALVTTQESGKVAGTGAWNCRVVINTASADLDASTNEKVTKQSALLSCTHGKAKVEVLTTATSHIPGMVTVILGDVDSSASSRLVLESVE